MRYFSDKVHAILNEEVPVHVWFVLSLSGHYITLHYITLHYITLHYITLQNTLRDGASLRRLTSLIGLKIFTSAFKFRAKYSHINLLSLSAKANLQNNIYYEHYSKQEAQI